MKTILCYGDSNTHGAATDGRYGPSERFTGVIRSELGLDWLVIEEGWVGAPPSQTIPSRGWTVMAGPI